MKREDAAPSGVSGTILSRKTEGAVREAFASLCRGCVKRNDGRRLPVRVQFMFDHFENMAPIPGFAGWMANTRRSGVSFMLALSSVRAFTRLYRDDWEKIAEGCNTVVFFRFCSSSAHESIRELMDSNVCISPLWLSSDECIVFVRGDCFLGRAYAAHMHSRWRPSGS